VEVTSTKKIKVRIVGCSALAIGSERYVRGDIIEIPENLFEADLYEKVEEPVKVEKKKKQKAEIIEVADTEVHEAEEMSIAFVTKPPSTKKGSK